MFTTAGEACRNKAMVDFSSAKSSPLGVTARGIARGSLRAAPPTQESRLNKNPIAVRPTITQMYVQSERRAGTGSVVDMKITYNRAGHARNLKSFEKLAVQSLSLIP